MTNLPRNIKLIILISFLLISVGEKPKAASAANASLYFSPQSGTFSVGSTFDVSVFLNTEGNHINAVQVDLKFPPELLQVTSPAAGSSFISIWADQPYYSNQEGIVSFKGGVPSPGINTSSGLVSTITFRVKAQGKAALLFLDSSQVLLADAKGTNILTTATRAEYILTIPPPEGPQVFSSTHPCLTCWYKDNNPQFFWEKDEGVTDFSYSFDQDVRGVPDNISEGPLTSTAFSDVSDGIWYFHLRAKQENIWGGVSHYPVQIDTILPEEFKINIEKIGSISSPTFFAYFSSRDQFSGIDYYEISIADISDPKATANPFFIEADSPYRIPFDSAGKYAILVRAHDKAGNFRESKSSLSIVGSLISYTENGIKIKNLFFPWWFIYILIFLIIIGLGFGVYYFLLRKRNLARRLQKEVAEAEKEIADVRELEERIKETRLLEEEAKKQKEKLVKKLYDMEEK